MQPIKFRFLLVLSAVFASACVSEPQEDSALATDAEAIITFPAAAYAGARPLTYGGSTALTFRSADGFVAVKFNGVAGDRVRFNVTAARAVRPYLVFANRVQQVLLDARDTSGSFTGALASTGEYFVMLRSVDRADLAMNVAIARETGGAGGVLYTNREIVAATATAGAPVHVLGRLGVAQVQTRECTTVSGCGTPRGTARVGVAAAGAAGALQWVPGLPVQFVKTVYAPPDGTVVSTHVVWGDRSHSVNTAAERQWSCGESSTQGLLHASQCWLTMAEGTPDTDRGAVVLAVEVAGVPTPMPFDFESTWTKTTGTLRLRSKPAAGSLTWTEYYADISAPMTALSSPRTRTAPTAEPALPAVTTALSPLDDEEVLSRLPAGSLSYPVLEYPAGVAPAAFQAAQFGGGFEANSGRCGPRTGCTNWSAVQSMGSEIGWNRFFPQPAAAYQSLVQAGKPMISIAATSTESYELRFVVRGGADDRYVAVPIANGRGRMPARMTTGGTSLPEEEVLVTAEGLLIRGGFTRTPAGSYAVAFPLRTAEPGYTSNYGEVRQWEYLVRFNRNW